MKKITQILCATATLLAMSQPLLADNNLLRNDIHIPINTVPLPGLRPTINFAQADLTFSSVRYRAPRIRGNRIEVPVIFSVKNQGRANAGRFKLSADYVALGNPRSFLAALSPSRSTRGRYMYKNGLRVGQSSRTFAKVSFPLSMRGKIIAIILKVDSCAGDEFMKPYCRISESNERNNLSRRHLVQLPR